MSDHTDKTSLPDITPVTFWSEGGIKAGLDLPFDPDWFAADSAKYNHELARFCSQFALLGYGLMVIPPDGSDIPLQPEGALADLGFEDIVAVRNTAVDQVNYYIARRKISIDGKEYDLVSAGFIGSFRGQWYTNFDPGRGNVHKGFADAADFAYAGLHDYLEKAGLDRSATKFVITGHSRGGVTANFVAARLIREERYATADNIFAYTFAAPNGTRLDERKAPVYDRIFNIVNDEDFVTKVLPEAWGYGKYGINLHFPAKSSSKEYKKILSRVREIYLVIHGSKYMPFRYGSKTSDKVIAAITDKIKNADDFYDMKFRSQGERLSVQEYFIRTVCSIVAEPDGSEISDAGTKYMLGTFLNRSASSKELRAIADFFALYEGIGSATTGKLSDTYFSFAHLAHTYCAFMLAIGEDDLTG